MPDPAPLDAAKALAPARTRDVAWRENAAYRYGWALFDAGLHWEAHEVWEAVWMRAEPNSRERSLLAGLIQVANARLKARMGSARAHERLMAIAGRHGSEVWPEGEPSAPCMGVSDAAYRALLITNNAK
ncbi:DUF309 domain-containing protein [Futiania mangrovi]|uniref:DUF309 domain-containing protein n=1 Tax=Futiania mangrovi TaxID=2959716 RepID=A0A9J6PBJ9_9PROT|nr:DUF309 domain-containing protein [Futiania mangrovii]MCP1335865.1 DUF309 domain-containing protein [Futiania mangrovii]